MKITARSILEAYEELMSLEEELDINPIKLSGDVMYFTISGEMYGFRVNSGEDAAEIWRKFSKMVTQFHAGGKALAWVKTKAVHEFGGKKGKPIPPSMAGSSSASTSSPSTSQAAEITKAFKAAPVPF